MRPFCPPGPEGHGRWGRLARVRPAALPGAALVALAVTASGGLARSADVSIAVSPRTVRYPAAVTVSGRVTGVDNPLGHPVELRWSRSPSAGFRTVRRGRTAEDGSYRFTVVPTRNTRYRVVVGGPTSVTTPAVETVELPGYTRSRCNHCRGAVPGGSFVVRQHGTVRFPPGLVLARASRRMYVYAGFDLAFRDGAPARGSTLRLLGARGRLVARGRGRYAWSVAFRVPAGTSNFWFDSCYRDPPGFGPLHGRHTCGELPSYRLPAPYLG